MFTRIRTLRAGDAVGLMVVGAVVALVLSGTAMAVTDTKFAYSTPQTGRLAIHPMDLAPANDASANNFSISYSPARLQRDHVGGCYNTGVNLPHLAKIVNVQTFFTSGVSSNPAIYLVRNEMATDSTSLLVAQTVFDDTATHTSVTHSPSSTLTTVNNNLYSYGYAVCLGPTTAFRSARITYTYTTAGD